MEEKTLFETLNEIDAYFTRCYMNAIPGGKMQEMYSQYLDTITEVKKLIKTKEENA